MSLSTFLVSFQSVTCACCLDLFLHIVRTVIKQKINNIAPNCLCGTSVLCMSQSYVKLYCPIKSNKFKYFTQTLHCIAFILPPSSSLPHLCSVCVSAVQSVQHEQGTFNVTLNNPLGPCCSPSRGPWTFKDLQDH